MTELKMPGDLGVIPIPTLTTIITDIQALADDDYALARRQGLGASDSSIILGVNPYTTKDDLLVQKRSKVITDAEREIKMKDSVRKGFDLEPLILTKFAKLMETEVPYKPTAMYQITATPCLTINFDGIILEEDRLIPVEAKFVTPYGDKYYNRKVALRRELGECHLNRACRPYYSDITDRIKAKAEAVGIPPYYYTQVQQQMYGLDAPYAYLVALHDKGWECVVYRISRDDETISQLVIDGTKFWAKVGGTYG